MKIFKWLYLKLPASVRLLVSYTASLPFSAKWRMAVRVPYGVVRNILPLATLSFIAVAVIFYAGEQNLTDTAVTNASVLQAVDTALSLVGLELSFTIAIILSSASAVAFIFMSYGNTLIFGFFDTAFSKDMTNKAVDAFLHANWIYLSRQNLGKAYNSIRGEVGRALSVKDKVVSLFAQLIENIIYLGTSLALTWELTLVLVGMQLVRILVILYFLPRLIKFSRERIRASERANSRYFAVFNDLKMIKANGNEARTSGSVHNVNRILVNLSKAQQLLSTHQNSVRYTLNYLVLIIGSAVGALLLEVNLDLLLFYLIVAPIINQRFESLFGTIAGFGTIFPTVQKVIDFQTELANAREPQSSIAAPPLGREVKFENVSYAYPTRMELADFDSNLSPEEVHDVKAVSRVNLKFKKGTITALVGPSGAGKTTILDLLIGLLTPSEGRVLIDGQDLATLDLTSWRSQVSYMQQQTMFFNDTVANNMRFFSPEASDEEMNKAAEIAQVKSVIDELPYGYETVLGERGLQVSGGQLQRLSLARGLLKQFNLLVLDESTSNLDFKSEEKVMEALQDLRPRCTIVISAHRITAAIKADRILFVQDGEIIEEGTPEELINAKGHFHEMWSKFLLKEQD